MPASTMLYSRVELAAEGPVSLLEAPVVAVDADADGDEAVVTAPASQSLSKARAPSSMGT